MARKKIGSLAILLLLALVCNTLGASACSVPQQRRKDARGGEAAQLPQGTPQPAATVAPVKEEDQVERNGGEIKELAAGGHSAVFESFVAVARDAETYAALRRMHEALPEHGADFFKSNAVVAAFLGQRRSGGYSVGITRTGAGDVRIAENAPGKGAMVTMALTAPFKIVSITADEEKPLALELDATWREALRPYQVSAGEFTRMGGFAGRAEKYSLAGDIRIMRQAQFATLFFNLKGKAEDGERALQDVATGTVAPEGGLSLSRLAAGSFVPPPSYPLRASGRFTDNESKLSLTFEVTRVKVNDGYGGKGTLEATATAPPPQKKAIAADDLM
ncbi:MAG: protease complex subunit PrcB family protein [Pyrinomonadaceae bacterium]